MKVFRDLFLRGSVDQIAATVDAIRPLLPADGEWQRDTASEQRLRVLPAAKPHHCFACLQKGTRPAASVFITQKDAATFFVANIVPLTKHQLSSDEYNGILEEFFERFARPAAAKVGVAAELTDSQAELEHWLSPQAAQKLRTFSACANRGTGASHPQDRERWNDFVVAAYREGSRMDPLTLRRWLTEFEGWAPEVADQLAGEYAFGKELLAFSDGRRSA